MLALSQKEQLQDDLEEVWDHFLLDLDPWQFHFLLKDGKELELHDGLISGEITWGVVFEVLNGAVA